MGAVVLASRNFLNCGKGVIPMFRAEATLSGVSISVCRDARSSHSTKPPVVFATAGGFVIAPGKGRDQVGPDTSKGGGAGA